MTGQTQANTPPLRRIRAKNLLSFGPDGIDLELSALNVLIGPNGSGKSNLFEVFRLLQAAPHDLSEPVRTGGGISDWIWKGEPKSSARVEALIDYPCDDHPLLHVIEFGESGRTFTVKDEWIERKMPDDELTNIFSYHRIEEQPHTFKVRDQNVRLLHFDHDRSILSQLKDPIQFPELSYLGRFYEGINLYGSWEFGRGANIRDSQSNSVRPSPLSENLSNLGMFLNHLELFPSARAKLRERLADLYEGVTDYALHFDPSTVQIRFTEGDFSIPASRLSDGSLKYLFLLAILLDPEPPRFIGIEEPELGLHPDLIPKMADLLVDASSRSQLLVTTHSDILVDALSHRPESVIVCEKHNGQTSMRRLEQSDLTRWLKRYSLGQLWTKGKLGGVRW